MVEVKRRLVTSLHKKTEGCADSIRSVLVESGARSNHEPTVGGLRPWRFVWRRHPRHGRRFSPSEMGFRRQTVLLLRSTSASFPIFDIAGRMKIKRRIWPDRASKCWMRNHIQRRGDGASRYRMNRGHIPLKLSFPIF